VRGHGQDETGGGSWPWSPASTLLVVAMLAAGTLWVVLGSQLTFFLDDWVFILYKRGFTADTFFLPDNEHLVAGPVAVWQLMLNTVGMGSVIPFRIVSTAMLLLGAFFFFVWVRRRLGDWAALIATVPILFLGAAFDDFLWFSSITFLGSMAAGMGTLVALDRRDRLGDGLACLGLTVSMLFSSLWLAFVIGAAVDVALRHADRIWWRRAYVVGVPLLLYALWWIGWGHEAESTVTLHNLGTTPLYVLDSFAAAVGALFGLAGPVEGIVKPTGLDWGQVLAVALGALAVWRLFRLERIPRSFWVVLAVGLAFWALGGIAVKPGRVPWASRYQYPGAVFVLLLAAELLRGIRLDRRRLVLAAVVVGATVIGSANSLSDAYESHRKITEIVRADLAALEIARDTVEPSFFIDEENGETGFVHVDAGSYLAARDAYGSPAYDASELLSSSEVARFAADKVLVSALRFGLAQARPSDFPLKGARPASIKGAAAIAVPAGACVAVPGGAQAPLLALPPAGAAIVAGAQPVNNIQMRRFAREEPSVDFGEGPGAGTAVEIATPVDASAVPWKMQLEGGAATVCGLSANGA
jgi:hypothetical protein